MTRPAPSALPATAPRPSATILPMPRATTIASLLRPRDIRTVRLAATPGWIEI